MKIEITWCLTDLTCIDSLENFPQAGVKHEALQRDMYSVSGWPNGQVGARKETGLGTLFKLLGISLFLRGDVQVKRPCLVLNQANTNATSHYYLRCQNTVRQHPLMKESHR